jgi:hypothetical protein
MKRFPDREELVAAYWQKLTKSIENSGAPTQFKRQAMNGRLRSRRPRDGGRVRQRSAALRAGRHLPGIRVPVGHHAQLHSHS